MEVPGRIQSALEGDVAVVLLEGQFTVEQFHAALDQVSKGRAPCGLLLDARRAEVNPPVEEVRRYVHTLASMRSRFRPPYQIVVGSDLHYGIGRMFAAMSDAVGMEVHVRRSVDEARGVLGL